YGYNPVLTAKLVIELELLPEDVDPDADGLPDNVEVTYGHDPLNADSDGDGVTDLYDDFPLNDAANVDTDGDGMLDDWNASCDTTCQSSSGLTRDNDDDND